MKRGITLIMIFACHNVIAQGDIEKLSKPIVEEGKKLYKSEMASWFGSDIFMAEYKDPSKGGGYISYSEGDVATCVFVDRADPPKVIAAYSFDSTFNINKAIKSYSSRDLTAGELILFKMRKKASELLKSDTIFKYYEKMNYNIIPLVTDIEYKVYLLTGPVEKGIVVFGNDYLIKFDKKLNVLSRKSLHKNLLTIPFGGKDENEAIAMHSHLPETGDFITATDICTLMLYSKFAGWKSHNVVSQNYLNIWNCESNTLMVLPMTDVKNILKHEEENNKKKK